MKPKNLFSSRAGGCGYPAPCRESIKAPVTHLRRQAFLPVLWLAALFVLSSCSEDEYGSTGGGSVKLRLSFASISDAVESDTRSTLAAPKTEKFYYTNPDGETLTELTIEELPPSSTRSSFQNMETGTYVRVYLYKKTSGMDNGDYYTSDILKVGSEDYFVMVEPSTDYYVKAVSYNSTTLGDVPGTVPGNLSTASLTGLSADKDVLYAATEITSGEGGSSLDINLSFSHKFSLVYVVADNSANTTGTITVCSANLNHKYGASLALNSGDLSSTGNDLGTRGFTWTTPNATAVTSDSATVYTGNVITGHVLTFTNITAGGTLYTGGTSVTFDKTFLPGKKYRLIVRFKVTTPVSPTNPEDEVRPTNTYVGAFWKRNQTGERLIRIPVGTDPANLGNWSAVVAWVDGQWLNGLSDIVLDTSESADLGITWNSANETPADMNDPSKDATYQVAGNATGVGGSVTIGDTIKFRIGLKGAYAATDINPARYAVVVVTYGPSAKKFNLYLRQGEDPDYVWSPSENYNGSTPREKAVRFSPYNLTASDLTDDMEYKQIAADRSNAAFTAYPTQAGAFFQWAEKINLRYAYHPVNPVGAPSNWIYGAFNASTYWDKVYWNTLGSTNETCPQNYTLTTNTVVSFRRPNDGITNGVNSTGAIAGSEMRQSLWEVPQSGQTGSVIGSVWGFYADGFFDRRSHAHAAYGSGNTVPNIAVSIATKDVAYIGRLFYNRDNKRSLFFPASGYRDYSIGSLGTSGTFGYYWSSSRHTNHCWLLHVGSSTVRQNNSSFSNGHALRCVRNN